MAKLVGRLGTWDLPHVHRYCDRGTALLQRPVELVSPHTRVATIGSCFAAELARALGRLGLRGGMHPGGLFYSSRTIRQELERMVVGWPPQAAEPLWRCRAGWVHPFKDYGRAFGTPEEALRWSDSLDREAEALFGQADVIVITLGLVEVWVHPEREVCYRQIPHPDVFATLGARPHRLTVAEMLDDLTRIRHLIRTHSHATLVVSVSPVPLMATFFPRDVRVANTESKSRIRAAVSELCDRHDDVHYFPSYEIVTTAERPSDFMLEDGRHVSRRGVDHILAEFVRMFGAPGLEPFAPGLEPFAPGLKPFAPGEGWITPPRQTAPRPGPRLQRATWRRQAAALLQRTPLLDRLTRGLWRRLWPSSR